MVFNSFSYLIFFPTLVAVYFLTTPRFRWIVVLFGSYFFYMSWKPNYGLLLFFTSLIDWLLAILIGRESVPRKRKLILAMSILMNLGVLVFFKYSNFISKSLWDIFG